MATDLSDRVFRETRRAIGRFNKYSDRELRRIKNLYIGARKRISGEIAENWPDIVKQGTTPYGLERLRGLQLGIDTQLGVLNQDLNAAIPQMVGDAGNMGVYRGQVELAQLLKEFPDLHPTFGIINTQAIDVYSGYALQLSQQYSAELTRQIQSALQMGLIDQKTVGQLVTEVRQYMGAEYGKPAKAITYKARRIARTEMARAYQGGHEAYGRSTDFIIGEMAHHDPMGPWPCAQCEAIPEGTEWIYAEGGTPPYPLHPQCYSDDTEVYTDWGWMLFKDLEGNEKILSLNPKTFGLEWLPYVRKVSYRFKGKLYHLKNRWFSLKVTPDHQHLFGRRTSKDRKKLKWEIKSTEDMIRYNEFRLPRTAKWKGINPEFISINGLKIKTEVFCRFMGFYLSEGSMTIRRQNCYQMSIAQSPDGLNEIYNDISEMPVKFAKGKDHIYCNNKRLGAYLLQFGKSSQKFVPDDIKKLSSKLIRIFLLAYCKGDGHSRITTWKQKNLTSREYIFSTSSTKMAGDLGELILRAGGYPSYGIMHTKGKLQKFRNGIYRIKNDQYRISWNKSNTAIFRQPEQIQEVDYDGYVYDVELPRNHILWVRYDGKTCFSGNCRCYTTFLYKKELFTPAEMTKLRGLTPTGVPVPKPDPTIEIMNTLRTGAILKQEAIRGGITDPQHLFFSKGIEGCAKSKYYQGEIASYRISKRFGGTVIPETTGRTFPGGVKGSVQRWIKKSKMAEIVDIDDHAKYVDAFLSRRHREMTLWDYLFGNSDRHGGNWVIKGKKKVWAIDNGFTFFNGSYGRKEALQLGSRTQMVIERLPKKFMDNIYGLATTKPSILRNIAAQNINIGEAEELIMRAKEVSAYAIRMGVR